MDPAYLILETGQVFSGYSPQWQQHSFFGEVVFNTGMVGYPETLTDPSYRGQFLTFSYPLIGNYGFPCESFWESNRGQVAGVICSEISLCTAHHTANMSLLAWLETQKIPVLVGVDTRALVKTLRDQGVVLGAISREQKLIKSFVNINQEDLAAKVTCREVSYSGQGNKTIIVVDCGIKNSILRHLENLSVCLKRVPYDYDYSQEFFDGVIISNGPGDPIVYTKTREILAKAMKKGKPIFGICLGLQIMGLAIGANTYKLPFGHRAQNHPCMDLQTNRCYLTSQNHGYAIDEISLPKEWQVTFKNLNDGTVQGIAHQYLPFFSVQFHPEASPGPEDTSWLFERFYELL